MNTIEAKRVEALQKCRKMRKIAQEIADDGTLAQGHRNLAYYTLALLEERREMAETIRDQRIMLGNVEAILGTVSRGYEAVKDDLHKAVMDGQ